MSAQNMPAEFLSTTLSSLPFVSVAVASLIQKEKPSILGSFRLVLLRLSLSSPQGTLNCKQPEKCWEGNIFLSVEQLIQGVLESESQNLI